jgi:hypothetical protein
MLHAPAMPKFLPAPESEQLPPQLGERLHSSDGERTLNDRLERNPEWLELADSGMTAREGQMGIRGRSIRVHGSLISSGRSPDIWSDG